MDAIYFISTPKTDKTIKEHIDIFVSNGWMLVETNQSPSDERTTRYTLGWLEDKGKAILPTGFKKLKIVQI